MDILDNQQKQIRDAERESLLALEEAVGPLGPEGPDVAALRQAVEDLEELFLLVVVGEFNAGKSAFINALLGEDVLPEGVTPTTASINLLRYGPQPTESSASDYVTNRTYPAPFLRDISVVDTPGTNAIIRQHETLTRRFVPRADMVLFITSTDRPFTESERGFMEAIREWGKKIVLVLNKIDLLSNQEDLDRVFHFIEEHSVALLGQKPEIFGVSARLAKKARASDNFAERDALLKASGFDVLEKYIFGTLDEAGRIRLKLLTPLGIAGRIAEKYTRVAEQRLAVLADDARTVENIEAQMRVYEDDMKREFTGRISQIENIVYELRERGEAFFEDTIKASRIRDLLGGDKIKREFEDRVVADSARRIDDATNGLIDWMVDQDLRLWQGISEYLNRRRQASTTSEGSRMDEHMIGTVGGGFEVSRQALLRSVVQEARNVVDSFDRRQEAENIAQDMRSAVAGVVAAGGVAALGVIVSIAVTSAFFDITGITAALVSGAIGLFILPYRKRKALQDFRARTQELRDKLVGAMTSQFDAELRRSLERIREAIAPYTRFVKVEQDRVSTALSRLGEMERELDRLRAQIETIGR